MRFLFMYAIVLYLVLAFLSTGCSSPEKTMNFFTPDRFGYGIIQGTSTWKGSGDMTTIWNSDIGDIYWDVDGEQESSMMYLEWDLPQWDDTEYDKYLRSRVRQLSLELEVERSQEELNTIE